MNINNNGTDNGTIIFQPEPQYNYNQLKWKTFDISMNKTYEGIFFDFANSSAFALELSVINKHTLALI